MTAPAERSFTELRAPLRCTMCLTALPDPPAAMVCSKCGRTRVVPHHRDWPIGLKRWLLNEYINRAIHAWLTKQEWWERLLTGAFSMQSRRKHSYPLYVNPDDVYLLALALAEEWKTAGSPTVMKGD